MKKLLFVSVAILALFAFACKGDKTQTPEAAVQAPAVEAETAATTEAEEATEATEDEAVAEETETATEE